MIPSCINIYKFYRQMKRLLITILLGGYFTIIQFKEYQESSFTIADLVYGSIFFIGFHGLHVLINLLMILLIY
jgi:cytochrome c oxidase subunit 3